MNADIPVDLLSEIGDLDEGPQLLDDSGLHGYFDSHPMAWYVLRRFLLYLFTLWASVTATFFFFRLIPGNPINAYVQNLRSNYVESASASQAVVTHYEAIFGLRGGLLDQYWHYLEQLVFHHNFGPSLLDYPESAQSVVAKALPWTIGLLLSSAIIAWVSGTVLGALAGWRRGTRLSEAVTWVSVAIAPIPFYFVGLVAVFLCAYRVPILPSGAPYGASVHAGFTLSFISSLLLHAVLPGFSIVLVTGLSVALGMRQQMVSVVGEDYLIYARAKGLPAARVLRRYAMANCYLPQLTGFMISFGALFGGNVLVEELFNYPGVGYTLVKAIGQLDLNTVLCISDTAIFGVLTCVFVLDLVMPRIDPRIRYSR